MESDKLHYNQFCTEIWPKFRSSSKLKLKHKVAKNSTFLKNKIKHMSEECKD